MNKCKKCGKKLGDNNSIHTCTPGYHLRKCKNVQEAINKGLLSSEDCEQYDGNNWHY